ncbi:hypothetical protein [Streptomyces sp. NPDC006333]|uniref:hypothetical protein n=1 Tax=Streptomyces sp. NPDC006333 TaxID=3156753 RepID=UPI0033AC6932
MIEETAGERDDDRHAWVSQPVGAATPDERLFARPAGRARHGARAHPAEVYGAEVSSQGVSTITTR